MAAELSVDVDRSEDGPAHARRLVHRRFAQRLPARQLDDLLLIVSELATNAVLHGAGPIRLRIRAERGRVYGEVIDEGRGFVGEVREHGMDAVGSKGLLIVAALAEQWGIHEGSSHVWFELAPGADRPADGPELGTGQRPSQLDA